MKLAGTGFARVAAALVIGIGIAIHASAASATGASVAVMPARTAAKLAPLATGFGQWVETRLADAGVPTVGGGEVRRALQAARRNGAVPSTRDLLAIAGEVGVERAVLIDLAFEGGRVDVLLRVHATGGKLLGAGRAAGAPGAMARSATTALERIIPVLGLETPKAPITAPFTLSSLSRRTRAMAALDAGELARAWSEIRDDATPDGERIREEIEQAAGALAPESLERARLLAAKGDAEQAWRSILRDASGQLYAEQPDVEMLVVAGEIHLARGKPHEAQSYFERAMQVAPDRAEPLLGYGQALSGQQDAAGAYQAFEKARALEPNQSHAAQLMTNIPELEPTARARAHMLAAEVSSDELDLPRSMTHWQSAIALDPTLAAEAHEDAGRLQLELGEHAAALDSYQKALGTGGATVERQRGIAHSLIALRDPAGAEVAYKEALEIERDDPRTLRELGELYGETQRHAEARQLLERAIELEPQSAESHSSLAQVLHEQGELEAALPHLEAAEQLGGATSGGLRELAAVQRKLARPGDAESTLERAIGLDPTSVALRQDLAAVYREQGRDDEAARQLGIVEMLGGTEALPETRPLAETAGQTGDGGVGNQYLDALVSSFGIAADGHDRAVLLGVRHAMDWKSRALDWVMPRTIDLAALESGLAAAIDPLYELVTPAAMDPLVSGARDQLLMFESRGSLDADAVATVNDRLKTNLAFVAVVQRPDWLTPSTCPGPEQLRVELRRLSGNSPPGVQILANEACIDGAETRFTAWNYKAAGVWAALVLLLLRPFLRGYGRVQVRVTLPDNTRALFSVSLTKRPRKIKAKAESDEVDAKARFNQKLRSLGRKERPVKRSGKMLFRWVPARSAEYYVTLHGPLYHSISEELIGDFLEERKVTVRRGHEAKVAFDLKPKDCPLEVMVYSGNDALSGAQVSLRGDPSTLRYTSNGSAFLYLPTGKHVVLAGARDRVAEREIQIDSFDPMPIVIDLAAEGGLVFKDCEDAVGPYLEGNFVATAMALENAGQAQLAALMKARAHAAKGDVAAASRLLEQTGQVTEAADLLAENDHGTASAALYEEAGDFARAAELHQAAGDVAAAARAYEAAYDYANAIACYQQLGDMANVLSLLEKSSDHYEAGKLAIELSQVERAVHNLQQIDSRHQHYSDACQMLGVVLADQGNRDFALEKFDEVRELTGVDSLPIEVRERYGTMLEEAGRLGDAIEVLASVRREDIHYKDVNTRITELKQRQTELDQERTRLTAPTTATAATQAQTATEPVEDRYELRGQLGAGGMGVVLQAKDRTLGRMVALKRLPENMSAHPAAIKFFEREARSAAALNHPNIVTVYDAGKVNGQYFITMELLEGSPLDAVVKKHGALPPLVVAQLGVQIATGLHFAHRNKIIHRDIKPANLFLTKEKIVKIMDFGLAKMVEEVRKGATVVGGTPYYLSPEQASGGEVDHRADLYSLGITLYQLACGQVPFSDGDIAFHHRNTAPPDPREFNAELPGPLADLIMKLIEKDPANRVQKAADVVRVLQSFIEDSARTRSG